MAAIGAVLLLALVSHASAVGVGSVTVTPEATVASLVRFTSKSQPAFSKTFQATRAPAFLTNNLKAHTKFTLFFPTDKALSAYSPNKACPQVPMSDVLAQLMVPSLLTAKDLKALKRGTKLRTMSPIYLTVLETKPKLVIGVVNGYQKVISKATVVTEDAMVNQRSFSLQYIDAVLTTCPHVGATPAAKSPVKTTQKSAVTAESSLAAVVKFTSKTQPALSKIFQRSTSPAYLVGILKKNVKVTLFFPTDKALAHYKPQGQCAKISYNDLFAGMMVPALLDSHALLSLKPGSQITTMSPNLKITVLATKPKLQIGIVDTSKKTISYATVVQPDALLNKRNIALHYVDNVLTKCISA